MTTPTALSQIRGLPVHVLLVHAVVVLVPLCAALLVLAAWWRPARVRLGPFLPLLAAGCLVLVPLTTSAGEWLQTQVGPDPLVQKHAELGDQLLPFAAGLLLLSVAVWWLGRRSDLAPEALPGSTDTGALAGTPVGTRAAAADGGGRAAGGSRALPPQRRPGSGSPAGGRSMAGRSTAGRSAAGRSAAGRAAPARPLVGVAVAVVATLVAVGSVVQVVRIGESGAKAVWHGVVANG